MTTNKAPDPARTLADAQRRWKTEPSITLTLPRGDAWLLLTATQLRRRDFDITYNLVHDLHRIGRTVQHAICGPDDLGLHQVAEAGWNPIADTIPGQWRAHAALHEVRLRHRKQPQRRSLGPGPRHDRRPPR